MKYRDVYLEQGKTLADSGTHTIDISPVDPISELLVNVWADNGATSNKGAPLTRVITKIEVVDGADVLFSMDGRTAHALHYYMSGVVPDISIVEAENYSQSVNIPLRFGRWLWDPIYALDPARFRNLQLKVTWNLAAVNAVGATGFVSGSAQLSVIAKVIEGLESPPAGFIMSKNHYSWLTGASGDERIALPTDYPYAMIMIRAWESGVNMSDSITNIKLNIDFDKVIPIDIEIGDLKNRVNDIYGMINLTNIYKGDDSEVHQAWMGDPYELQAIANAADRIVGLATLDAGQYSLYFRDGAGATPSAVTCFVRVRGLGIWNCLAIPFGVLQDPTTYLQAQEHGDIKLVLTQGNAGAEADVIVSQLRPF